MKQILLKYGRSAIVDNEDYERLNKFQWREHESRNSYYAERSVCINGNWETILMHRAIMNPTDTERVDHWDCNGLNNQKKNLRIITEQQRRLENHLKDEKWLAEKKNQHLKQEI